MNWKRYKKKNKVENESLRSDLTALNEANDKMNGEITEHQTRLAQALDELNASLEQIKTLKNINAEVVQSCDRIKELYAKILPEELLMLAGYSLNTDALSIMDDQALALLFSFLAVVSREQIEDRLFLERFRVFDKELYSLYKNEPDLLAAKRKIYQDAINKRLKEHSVHWDIVGEKYNDEHHYTEDSDGNKVLEVIFAQILGPIYRQRATVRTSLSQS